MVFGQKQKILIPVKKMMPYERASESSRMTLISAL